YGWAFTGFLITSIVGMVVSGLRTDRRGPRLPLLLGLSLFVAGLVLAAAAGAMWVLIAARVVQGLAVGLLITAIYVVMGEVYPDQVRPRMFAALSTSWIVPGLVGPILAGWVTQQLSWRWVFGGLAPIAAASGLMLVPAVRRLRSGAHTQELGPGLSRVGFAVLTALGIAAVAEVGQRQSPATVAIAVLGLAAMLYGLHRLLPAGTARFAPGVPAAIAYRGVLAATWVGMEVLVPLTLTVQRHYSPTMAGLPLLLTALTWAGASQIQGRSPHVGKSSFVRVGLALFGVGGLGMALVALRTVPGWFAYLVWPVAGAGAGFALTAVSVAVLEYTTDVDRGSDSSSLQLADSSMSAVSAAFSGALVALSANGTMSYAHGLGTAFAVMALIALLAIIRAGRLRPGPGRPVSAEAAARSHVSS
ncbi:MAG TPA: MFS transporter, partial [Jatrophihabitans sp.]|nr:MFS transporter [Jatrophihabitans sp.]